MNTEITLPTKTVDPDASLEERLTENAYQNILPARYLKKDKDGNVSESADELFYRIATNVALAEVLYEAEKRDTTISVTPQQIKPHPNRNELIEAVFGLGTDPSDETTTELTEANIKHFSYERVVSQLNHDELAQAVEETSKEFETALRRLSFIPNSPTLMNAGNELQQLSACFVMSPDDDISSIHTTAKEAAEVFQSGGGVGYAFSHLRPYGDKVGSTGGIASGPITFMRTYDQMCETIAQGGARRGAQMGVMRVSHPDIIQFIHAKNKDVSLAHTLRLNDPDDYTHNSFADALEEARDLIDEQERVPKHLRNAVEGHLSNFNISVGITNRFMEAVKNDDEYTFTNPRTGEAHIATPETKELYDLFGLGSHVDIGSELSIPANLIWERIVEGAHENGEPGVLFLERANKQHSFDVDEHPEYRMHASNPCGEQFLMEYESCNLGHINLSTIVTPDAPDWRVWSEKHAGEYDTDENAISAFLDEAVDWDELDTRIEIGTRFLDNVVTMSNFPVDQIQETVANNRKIGLGIMGLAQLYIQLGIKYGNCEANDVARQLMKHINYKSKKYSQQLANERGVFDNWSDSKYADPTSYPDWFRKHTGEDPEQFKDGFKIRNHNTTTIAPTGTTSMVANTTGGCEPIYNVAYFKNVSEDIQGDEMLVEFDDYFLRVLEANNINVQETKQEAEKLMNDNEFHGIESLSSVPNPIAELFITTNDLSAKEHAKIQCALQEGVDSSISKTVNAPAGSTLEDARTVFEYIYDNGGKGVTYYRDGTRSKQVLTTRADNTEFASEDDPEDATISFIQENFDSINDFLQADAIQETLNDGDLTLSNGYSDKQERPGVLHGVTQRVDTGYGKLYVNINEDPNDNKPFELFANIGNSGGFTASFTEALAKTISTALRSGVDPHEIADELQGIRSPKVDWDKGKRIDSIPDAIGIALSRYLEGEVKKQHPQQQRLEETKKRSTDNKQPSPDGGTKINPIEKGENPECPDCSSLTIYYSEGCKSCETCGWSQC